MSEEDQKKSAFERRWQGADDERVGARWWHDDARANEGMDRRQLIKGLLIGGGVLAGGALLFTWANRESDTVIENKDSLDVQRAEGWNVGADDRPLAYPGAQKI